MLPTVPYAEGDGGKQAYYAAFLGSRIKRCTCLSVCLYVSPPRASDFLKTREP